MAVTPKWTAPPADLVDSGRVDNEEDYVADESELLVVKETGYEEYKSRTLLLLSQLKLGTEVTKTTLPVFFCENRSVLQVLADAFRRPELLLE